MLYKCSHRITMNFYQLSISLLQNDDEIELVELPAHLILEDAAIPQISAALGKQRRPFLFEISDDDLELCICTSNTDTEPKTVEMLYNERGSLGLYLTTKKKKAWKRELKAAETKSADLKNHNKSLKLNLDISQKQLKDAQSKLAQEKGNCEAQMKSMDEKFTALFSKLLQETGAIQEENRAIQEENRVIIAENRVITAENRVINARLVVLERMAGVVDDLVGL